MNRFLALASSVLAATFIGASPATDPGQARAADTVALLVRHAEKAAPGGDVPLSAAGEVRARALVDAVREAGVTGIITTQFQRTKQTAAPLAAALNVTPEVVDAQGSAGDHAGAVAGVIRQRYAGRTVLVVGHSNTVPAIIVALGGPRLPDLCDDAYDNLFIVVLSAEASPRLIRSKYGATSRLPESCGAMK